MIPYHFQDLAAALLKAVGYYVLWIAPLVRTGKSTSWLARTRSDLPHGRVAGRQDERTPRQAGLAGAIEEANHDVIANCAPMNT